MALKILTLSAIATTFALFGVAPTPGEPSSRDVEVWAGTIQDWHVDSRGVVAIHLRTRNAEGEPEQYWFRSPGDRSGTTMFEDLLLRILFETGDQPLRIHAARESMGDSVESALLIEAVSSMPEEGRTGRTGR